MEAVEAELTLDAMEEVSVATIWLFVSGEQERIVFVVRAQESKKNASAGRYVCIALLRLLYVDCFLRTLTVLLLLLLYFFN